jgi:autotransporter-associated beta strand protein
VGEAITFFGSNDLDFGSVPINANNGQQETWNIVSNKLIFEGDINSGNTTITKIGQGTLVLSGIAVNNQFTGIINEGEIDLAKDAGAAIGTGGQGFLVQSNAVAKITGGGGNQIPDSIGGGSYILTRLNAGGVLDMNGQTEALDMLAMTNGVLRNSAPSSFSTLNLPGDGGSHPTNAITLYGNNNIFDVPTADAELDINGIINGAASYAKTGLGTLSLLVSNSYTGNVTVNGGTLIFAFPDLTNTTTVTIAANSVLNLNFANGETNTIAALTINGVSKAPGVYSATTDPTYIAGAGSLLVVPVAPPINPNPGILQLSNAGAGTLQLAWPTNAGWILQSNSVGLTATSSWFPIQNSTNLTNINVTVDPSATNVFFRLLHP